MTTTPSLRPSLAELFITNLRLLNLDRLTDYPNISSSIFSSRDVLNQDQKARIRCSEWALYRLFELWDPVETREKLQPFFPPLEPLQSLNLRGALYRLLNDLKKNGVLGRETLLRKTMLDECKGDKFLEILVTLSTLVVKKVALPRFLGHDSHQTAAIRMSTASALSPSAQDALLPLTIASHSSLAILLHTKLDAKDRCIQFANLLDQKVLQLQDREDSCGQARVAAPTSANISQIDKQITENWLGHSNWPRALLYGDEVNPGDQPLKQPFQHVWEVVIQGGALEPPSSALGLVENLKQRVDQQRSRLSKWRAFHKDMARQSMRNRHVAVPELNSQQSFDFFKHQKLNLNQAVSQYKGPTHPRFMNPKLESILSDLKGQLQELSKPVVIPVASPPPPEPSNTTIVLHSAPDFAANRGHTRAGSSTFQPRPFALNRSNTAVPLSRVFSPAKAFRATGRSLSSTLTETSSNSSDATHTSVADRSEPTPPPTPKNSLDDYDNGRQNELKSSPESSTASPTHSGDDITENIIQSVINSYSPPQMSRMSLAERTRMSVSQANTNIQPRTTATSHPDHSVIQDDDVTQTIIPEITETDRRQSLLERTQQSMFNINMKPSRPRHSIAMAKKRQSVTYPVNQFETPGRPKPTPMRDATPTEKLFAEDAEYASVFKSRPRIAVSPGASPGEFDDLPDIINEEAEDDGGFDVDGDSWLRSSPLRGKG